MLNLHLFLPDNSRQRIIDSLVDHEGFGLAGLGGKPYYDTNRTPRLTIGYGFNLESDPDKLQLVLDQIYGGANPTNVAQFKSGFLNLVQTFRPSQSTTLSIQGSKGQSILVQAKLDQLAQQNGLSPFVLTQTQGETIRPAKWS